MLYCYENIIYKIKCNEIINLFKKSMIKYKLYYFFVYLIYFIFLSGMVWFVISVKDLGRFDIEEGTGEGRISTIEE